MSFVLNKDWNVQCILYFHWRPRQQLELLPNGTARKVSAQDKNDKSWLTCNVWLPIVFPLKAFVVGQLA